MNIECIDCKKLIPEKSLEHRCDECWDIYWKKISEDNELLGKLRNYR